MAHQVFISFCRADKALAEAACQALEAAGVPCWIVPRNVPPGALYADVIPEAISQARLAVIILSAATVDSPYVRAEVRHAFEDGLGLVTFRTDHLALDNYWRYYLGSHHWVDASAPPSPQAHLADLVAAVRRQTEARQARGERRRYGIYEVLSSEAEPAELGVGWTGRTYRAFDQDRRDLVALKVLGDGAGGVGKGDELAQETFMQRAVLAESLRHPNVAAVLGHGIEKGRCFYASEYVEGVNLRRLVGTRGPLPPAAALLLARQAAEALDAASGAKLVHGNLKPSNLLLSRAHRGTNPMVKLTHFWLGRRPSAPDAAADLARGFVTMALPRGEPTFASPEAFEGGELNERSDIFSLGAVLWFLLTGRAPFDAAVSGFRHGFFREPDPVPGMPVAVDRLVRAMLQLDPAARPGGFATLADVLAVTAANLGIDEGAGQEADDLDFPTIIGGPGPARGTGAGPSTMVFPAVAKPVVPPLPKAFPAAVAEMSDNSLFPTGQAPSKAVPPPPALTGNGEATAPLVFGPFRVLQRPDGTPHLLGQGGMGMTYKAMDSNLDRVVALKVINTSLISSESSSQDRFLREARSAASLRHPNIASVLSLGEQDGESFYAMEFVDGETADHTVKRLGPLPVAMVVDIGIQVARALAAADRQNLVHRDIKPANIMLVRDDETSSADGMDLMGDPTVKLIDFGLARTFEQKTDLSLTMSGFVGTPIFASPEQIEERPLDTRSDIYSLGCTLWYMLTGQPPFSGTVGKLFSQHLGAPPPLERLEAAHVPPALCRLLASMLAKDPAARPQNPNAVRAELEEILRDFKSPAMTRGNVARSQSVPDLLDPATSVDLQPSAGATTIGNPSRSASGNSLPVRDSARPPLPPPPFYAASVALPWPQLPQASAPPPAVSDALSFTACVPGRIAPGTSFLLDIWAHTATQRAEVRERAGVLGRQVEAGRKGPVAVARGTTLVVHVTLAGFTVGEPTDVLLWNGEIANATFAVGAPVGLAAGRYPGQAVVRVSGVPVARLVFEMEVLGAKPEPGPPDAGRQFEAHVPRTAFASYAVTDRNAVLGRLQGMRKLCPDLEIFLDAMSFRSGEDWERRLAEQVPGKDVFFLFWSRQAARSHWVEYEWRLALARRGLSYIDPIPLEGLDQCPPPEELRALHFGDSLLAFQRGEPPPTMGLFKKLVSVFTRQS